MSADQRILNANLARLRLTEPELAQRVCESTPAPLAWAESRAGPLCASIEHRGQPLWLASRYDPLSEAQNLAAKVDLSKDACVMALGLGLGYHVAQIAAQMGAHIIKVKLPSDHIEQDPARKVYEAEKIPVATMTDRVKHVVQSAFDGRRMVIFSGGGKKGDDAVFDEIRAIRDGGGFGSIIGRNSFQRPRDEAIKFLHTIMDIYLGAIE